MSKQTTYLILFFLLSLSQQEASAQVVKDSSLATILARAYSMLQAKLPEAETLFEKAVTMDPQNALLRTQLGYVYHSKKKYEQSLRQFMIADSLKSSDTTKLQIAFNLITLNRQKEAEKILKGLQSSQLPDIRNAANDQLSTLPSSLAYSPWWTRIYLSPYYDTRWKTSFYFANLQEGYYLTDDKKLSAYGFISLSGDARSKGGLSPAIFSDNAMIVGVGFNAKPFTGFQLNAQQGITFDLVNRGNRSRTRGDFRAFAIYNNGIYPAFTLHDDLQMTLSPLLDLYSSVGYYSRYNNGICYLQGRAGVRVLEISYTAVDIYAKAGLARDTKKEYYNNLLEGGLGARLIPNINLGLYFIGEFHRGYYWDVGTTYNPYGKYYNSFRFFIVFDRIF